VASQTRWSGASRLLRPPARFAAIFRRLARWIVRLNFRPIAEPARPEDGGDEGVLPNLVVASLNPRA
jgi:hypothetical protein